MITFAKVIRDAKLTLACCYVSLLHQTLTRIPTHRFYLSKTKRKNNADLVRSVNFPVTDISGLSNKTENLKLSPNIEAKVFITPVDTENNFKTFCLFIRLVHYPCQVGKIATSNENVYYP